MPDVTRSLDVQAPPSRVWRWFESQEALRRWLAPTIEIDLRVGGAYRMQGADETSWISGVVLDLVPEGRLVLSWLEEDAGWRHPGRLVIALESHPVGTRVTLVHDGFAGIGLPDWERVNGAYERGADRHQLLNALAELVAAG